jgi:hypothetical protein
MVNILVVKYTTSEIRKCSFCRLLSENDRDLIFLENKNAGNVRIT